MTSTTSGSNKQYKHNDESEFKYSVKHVTESVNQNKIIIKKTKKYEFDLAEPRTDGESRSGLASPVIALISRSSSESESQSARSSTDTTRPGSPAHAVSASDIQPVKLQIPMEKLLERECTICKTKVHQDRLYEHVTIHYYENSQCRFCDKVFSNPSSFVTHTSSHSRKYSPLILVVPNPSSGPN